MKQTPKYIAVEGPLGVGKTSLVQFLNQEFGYHPILEIVEENPYLGEFHVSNRKYAFQSQIFFLQSRLIQQQEIQACILQRKHVASDYSFLDKAKIFVKLFLFGSEADTYWRLREAIQNQIPSPDLTIYLFAQYDTVLQRINLRNREFERQINPQFVHDLVGAYEDYYADFSKGNLLKIDTTAIDFVHRRADLLDIVEQIESALRNSTINE